MLLLLLLLQGCLDQLLCSIWLPLLLCICGCFLQPKNHSRLHQQLMHTQLQADHPAATGTDLDMLALSGARQKPKRSGPVVAAVHTQATLQATLLQLCLYPVTVPPLLQPPAAASYSHLLLIYTRCFELSI